MREESVGDVLTPERAGGLLPFRPRHASRGWPGGVVAERYADLAPHEVVLPPEACARVTLQVRHARPGRFRRGWGGAAVEGVFDRPHLTVAPAGRRQEWACEGRSDSLHVLLPPELLAEAGGPAAGVSDCLGDADDARGIHLLQIIDLEVAAEAVDVPLLNHLALALARHLLLRHGGLPAEPPVPFAARGLSERQLGRVKDLMRRQMGEKLRVADFARAARLGPTYFKRLFGRSTGRTPHDYLTEMRLEEAKALLVRRPDMTVLDVAARCGFSDESHLAKRFQARFGRCPSSLRPQRASPGACQVT